MKNIFQIPQICSFNLRRSCWITILLKNFSAHCIMLLINTVKSHKWLVRSPFPRIHCLFITGASLGFQSTPGNNRTLLKNWQHLQVIFSEIRYHGSMEPMEPILTAPLLSVVIHAFCKCFKYWVFKKAVKHQTLVEFQSSNFSQRVR